MGRGGDLPMRLARSIHSEKSGMPKDHGVCWRGGGAMSDSWRGVVVDDVSPLTKICC